MDRRLVRRLHRSRRGVTDVPLELLVIIIILAIVVPIIVAALITYSHDQQLLTTQQQAIQIQNVATQAFDDGINTTLLLSVSVPGTTVIVGDELFLGGSWNAATGWSGGWNWNAAWITWGTSGDLSKLKVNNGATDVALTNITCSGYGAGLTITFHPYYVPNTHAQTIALTKLAPGAFICGTDVSAFSALAFIEVQPAP